MDYSDFFGAHVYSVFRLVSAWGGRVGGSSVPWKVFKVLRTTRGTAWGGLSPRIAPYSLQWRRMGWFCPFVLEWCDVSKSWHRKLLLAACFENSDWFSTSRILKPLGTSTQATPKSLESPTNREEAQNLANRLREEVPEVLDSREKGQFLATMFFFTKTVCARTSTLFLKWS